ncbi:MAG: ATP-binding protein [Methylomonas sp.]|nr:ATP-binding protein [Methylomonas sp.]
MPIRFKLFVILLMTSLTLVGGMYGFVRWSLEDGFGRFIEKRQEERVVNLLETLKDCYVKHDGWALLKEDRRHWLDRIWYANHTEEPPEGFVMLAQADDAAWPPTRLPGFGYGSNPYHFELRVMLFDADRRAVVARDDLMAKTELRPIVLDNRNVGYLGLLPGKPSAQPLEAQFFYQQSRAFIGVAAIMVLLSAGLASVLAYWLVIPVKELGNVVQQLAAGDYKPRMVVHSGDELGKLGTGINRLAAILKQSEQSRRQWVADISHELRTPLAVLRAELEALQDGIRPLRPAAVDLLLKDVLRLNRLTDDLYQLALSDQNELTYHCLETEPWALLRSLLESLKTDFEQKSLRLEFRAAGAGDIRVWGDPDRLSQLFRNLLLNSLAYTDAGGCLTIIGFLAKGKLCLEFSDSSPAVAEEELARLFERFYRVEGSRNRNHGGAGLGLALCQSIVEAHGGDIAAAPSELGGLKISVGLPVYQVAG